MPYVGEIRDMLRTLQSEKLERFRRRVPIGDLLTDRWENARQYGWGDGTSCYDSVLVIGDVRIGDNTWIGPNVILEGSGGLVIGDYCSINAGAQIYTHNSVQWAVTMGEAPYEHAPTKIGSGVFIGAQSVIAMGVNIGDRAVIGAMSLVVSDIPAGVKAWGQPAKPA